MNGNNAHNQVKAGDQWSAIAAPWSSHGCTAAWSGTVMAVDNDGFNVMIEWDQDCGSCWQTGCTGDAPSMVGQMARVHWSDVVTDNHGNLMSRA